MDQDPLVGRRIGPYRVESRLGEGGMGAVYRAVHENLDRNVALKVLLEHLVRVSPDYMKRFLIEARAAAKVDHPNVVRVFDAGAHEGTYFIAMEFVQGMDLRGILRHRSPLSEWEAVSIALQAEKGLEAASKLNIIHRDVKPANLLLTVEGVVKVADFGLAKNIEAATELTASGEYLGTPAYMSPEQADGDKVDFRADMYSLGVCLFEMTTGERPYTAETPIGLIKQHCLDPIPDPRERRSGLHPRLGLLIRRMMGKHREERFDSYGDLRNELEALERECRAREESGDADAPKPSRKQALSDLSAIVENFLASDASAIRPSRGEEGIRTAREETIPLAAGSGERRTLGAFPPPGFQDLFLVPIGKRDSHGNPVAGQGAARTKEAKDWPREIWLTLSTDDRPSLVYMEFVLVPAGHFDMGSSDSEEGRMPNEDPMHRVEIRSPFYMGKYPVTQVQWTALMEDNPSRFAHIGVHAPVERVSWSDAQAFFRDLNRILRSRVQWDAAIRLPTESEWEYACRAGAVSRFASGNGDADLNKVGWFSTNSGGRTHPVGEKSPNLWGLYDMHGNVWEWCQDPWHASYECAPANGECWAGGDTSLRVLRGGSWLNRAVSCRCAHRDKQDPETAMYNFGLRVVLADADPSARA